jgi:hypothetical protein
MRDKTNRKRLRIYSITEEALVALFRKGTFSIPDIPEDAVVDSVQGNWALKSIDVCFWHESFDSVPEGQLIPNFSLKDPYAR